MITSNRIRVWDITCPDPTNSTTTVFGLPERRNCHQISFRSKPGWTCCWVGPGKTAVGSVEGSAKGLLGFEQFPVPKAYEADEVSGSVHMIITPTILTNMTVVTMVERSTWMWSWCSLKIFGVVPRVLNFACLKEISGEPHWGWWQQNDNERTTRDVGWTFNK